MRKQAKLLANFLGATKELTTEYAELAEITQKELDQIGHSFNSMKAPERKQIARVLKEKGWSLRPIAEALGSSPATIMRDLGVSNETKTVSNETPDRDAKEAAIRESNERLKAFDVEPVAARYGTIVIDPPWQVEKIKRDVRPNQVAFDYPTMTEEELMEFPVKAMAEEDCHLFCWTTHKHLLPALRLIEVWGFKYILLMTWHKPGGFQPHGLPQYNSEFVIYARRGSPQFRETTAFNTCFQGERREHSRKPDEFYNVVRRVTGDSRIDVFSREPREGFAQYGNETSKFMEGEHAV